MSVRTPYQYKRYIGYFLIVGIFLIPNLSLADCVPGKCSADGYTIATINGIRTNERGARENMVALKDAAGTFYNKQNIDYEYLLNPS
ncbi:MAG: hypothetical protein KGJ13_11970, partial [Patescibacteria group bacterium]|nr:hypothetical protein [Patescibacteria group bacterium]